MRRLQIILFSFFLSFFAINRGVFAIQFYDKTVSFYDNSKNINSNIKSFQPNQKYNRDDGSEIRSLDNQPFNWKNYEDPAQIQFWDSGGDFVPALPWRYLAANPTEDNVEKYIEWQNKKIAISSDLQKKIASKNSRQQSDLSDENKKITQNSDLNHNEEIPKNTQPKPVNWNDFEIAYFYQTSCHYCQNSNSIVAYLNEHGAKIIPIQIDWDRNSPTHSNSVKYDKNLHEKFHVSLTPTWVLKTKTGSKRIDGYISQQQLEEQALLILNKKT